MTPIELQNVGFRYSRHDTPVLRLITMRVEVHELVVILGTSGSGKSTLLRLIAGLLRPSEGDVRLRGLAPAQIYPRERQIGFVFQNLALFPNLSAGANIRFGLRYASMTRSEQGSRLDELVRHLHLSQCMDKRPGELSGGQAQRVALARALAPNPEILLLDEPFSSLDRPLADAARALVVNLHRELSLTTLLVTHDREQALSVADRIIVLSFDGTIAQDATPADVYQNPATIEVARLTGAVNAIGGSVQAVHGQVITVDVSGEKICARWTGTQPAAVGEWVVLAFRPEWVRMARAGEQTCGSIEVLVTQDVTVAGRRHIHCAFGDAQLLIEPAHAVDITVGKTSRIAFGDSKPIAYAANEEA